jgi:hypothetical protein
MRHHRILVLFAAVLFLAAAAAAQTAPPAQAQEKKPVDTAKLFAEIAGSFAYDYQGQGLTVNFWVESGKLYGAPPGQEAEYAEVILKDADKMIFEAAPPNGQLYEIEFSRGEDGKITKSILRTMGLEVPGVRIK